MNKILSATFIAAALSGATAAYSYNPDTLREAGITIEFNEAEQFTDFKVTPAGRESERQYLIREMRSEINRAVRRHLPPGYQLSIRINDVDMAGEFRPEFGPDADRIRFMRDIHPPRVRLEYALADAEGNVIASGSETLTDRAYNYTVRRLDRSQIGIEADLVANLVRNLSRKVS